MVFVDILLGIPTPKLSVPSEFKVRYTPSEIASLFFPNLFRKNLVTMYTMNIK